MEPSKGKLAVHVIKSSLRRHNIKRGEGSNPFWMIKCHAMSDTRASIVTNNMERFKAKFFHHFNLILCGRAFAVDAQVTLRSGWLFAVTIATQIRGNDGVMRGKFGSDLMPFNIGLGIPVQQQQGWSSPAMHEVDRDTIGFDSGFRKVVKHHTCLLYTVNRSSC